MLNSGKKRGERKKFFLPCSTVVWKERKSLNNRWCERTIFLIYKNESQRRIKIGYEDVRVWGGVGGKANKFSRKIFGFSFRGIQKPCKHIIWLGLSNYVKTVSVFQKWPKPLTSKTIGITQIRVKNNYSLSPITIPTK